MMKKFYVYSVRNIVNGKLYIGQTGLKNPLCRWAGHVKEARRGSKYLVHSAIRKYGQDKFEFEVLGSVWTRDEVSVIETELISVCRSRAPHGYNLAPGGYAGYMSPAAREASRQQMLRIWAERKTTQDPVATREKNRLAQTESWKRLSPKETARRKENLKRPLDIEHKHVLAASRRTPTARASNSEAQRRAMTEERKAKMQAARRTPEARKNNSLAQKKYWARKRATMDSGGDI